MEFIAFIGEDRENWGQIHALLKRIDSHKILVKDFSIKDFPEMEGCEIINVDSSLPLLELRDDMINKLKSAISGEFEVSISLASGNGKEHMALLSALLGTPVGVKIIVYTKNGIEFLS